MYSTARWPCSTLDVPGGSDGTMDLIRVEQLAGQHFRVTVRGHVFETDMSLADHGNDAAPSPSELLVGALGACMGMLVNRYCVNHEYPAEGIGLDVTFQLADKPKRIAAITADLTLPEGFPEDRREAVQRAVHYCVVHNTLDVKPEIDLDVV